MKCGWLDKCPCVNIHFPAIQEFWNEDWAGWIEQIDFYGLNPQQFETLNSVKLDNLLIVLAK